MIQGKFVQFRSIEVDDLPKLKDWRNNPHVKRTTREFLLLNMFNQKLWFESLHKQKPPKDIMFGIVKKKEKILIGVCGLTYIDWKNRHAELSIYLAGSKWQKRKETKDSVKLLLQYGFGELGLHKIFAEVYSFVQETVELYKELSFHHDGILRENVWRNGKWWDSYILSKLDTEFQYEKSN